MKVKQLRTEYVQVWSVSRCLLLGERENPQKSISLLSVFAFPTVNVFLESDKAGSWWKPFIFLDEAGFTLAMTWRRGWEPSGWEGPHSKISAMGLRIPSDGTDSNHGFRPIYSLSPSPLPPYSPFLTVTQLRSFSPHGGGRFSIGSSQTSLSSPGYRWCIQWPMSGLYSPYQKMF